LGVLGVVFGLASSNAAAGQQPTQIRFDLHEGNFMIGYAYPPPGGIARALPVPADATRILAGE
jgi:hypothetical protein